MILELQKKDFKIFWLKAIQGSCSIELWNKYKETIRFVTTRVISDLQIPLARWTSKVGGGGAAWLQPV